MYNILLQQLWTDHKVSSNILTSQHKHVQHPATTTLDGP